LPAHRFEADVRIQVARRRIVLAHFQANPPCALLLRRGDGRFNHRASDAHPPVFWMNDYIANHLAPGAAWECVT